MRRWMVSCAVLALAVVLSSGCSSYAVGKYGVSVENVTALRALGDRRVSVGPFGATKPGQTSIACRAVGPVTTPDGKPFEEYVRQALVDELRVAQLFGESAPVTLSGTLNEVAFSSTSGAWTLDLTVTSSNGRSLTVREKYDYATSFVGEKACALTAQAFGPAVQSLIARLVQDPDFGSLLR
jgi:hypothetical protein